MSEDRSSPLPTLALNTKVEEDFVAPLTAVRGSLELLRDIPDLSEEDRQRFLDAALRGCARLEQAIEQLASTVYAAGQEIHSCRPAGMAPETFSKFAGRIKILEDFEAIEVDFGDFTFKNSKLVNDFYDVIEELVDSTGRSWYFLINYRNCSIWPEAWVAFAHRSKKVNVNASLGSFRYDTSRASEDPEGNPAQSQSFDPSLFGSREAAIEAIVQTRAAGSKA